MTDFIVQIILVLVLMVIYNLLSHVLLHDNHKLAFAIFMSTVIILIGLNFMSLSLADFGFGNPVKGLIYGGGFASVLIIGIGIGSTYKKTKNMFRDTRVLNISPSRLLRKTLIDIPITTVLFEEILFRGLILGFLLTQTDQLNAMIGSSVLFGVWHILPALKFSKTNGKASGFPLATVVGTVLFTGLTGMLFAWLRVESTSILAPMVIHFVANSGGFAASWHSSKSNS